MRASGSFASRVARSLSWAVAAAMASQAAVGLLMPSLYLDVAWIKAAWFGNDVVTLFVAAPLLVLGLVRGRRGSARGQLFVSGALGYSAYNYGYYMFGARIGVLFPLFVALFVASVWALVLTLSTMDVGAIADRFHPKTPVRSVAGYMMFTGVGLSVAWLAQWAALVFTGKIPSVGADPFALVAAMDLSFVVPNMIVAAVLLWRRRPWGYVLGAIMNIKGATYTLVLTVSSVVGGLRGIEGSMEQAPVWGIWALVGLIATVALLWRVGRSEPATR